MQRAATLKIRSPVEGQRKPRLIPAPMRHNQLPTAINAPSRIDASTAIVSQPNQFGSPKVQTASTLQN